MQARRSGEPHRGSHANARTEDRQGLIHAYDEEENLGFGLTDLTEDSDDEGAPPMSSNGKSNGKAKVPNGNNDKRSFSEPVPREREHSRKSPPLPR